MFGYTNIYSFGFQKTESTLTKIAVLILVVPIPLGWNVSFPSQNNENFKILNATFLDFIIYQTKPKAKDPKYIFTQMSESHNESNISQQDFQK